MSGPLTKLQWSKWILAATDKRPLGYSSAQYPRSKYYGWEHTFVKQKLFDDVYPSIYEVGVKFPDVAKRKIYVMYFKLVNYHKSWRSNNINALTLVKASSERRAMANLVRNKIKIYFRRATGNAIDIKAAVTYLHKGFDYAWGWKRRNCRRVIKNGVVLS